MPQGHIYILASNRNGTLYIGVTTNLPERIFAHRNGTGSAFTKKYGVKHLVWYETYDIVKDAIQRETTLKHWLRKWKLDLIKRLTLTGMTFTRRSRSLGGRVKPDHGERGKMGSVRGGVGA